eukprot:5949155-Prymnesium_polylepis.1
MAGSSIRNLSGHSRNPQRCQLPALISTYSCVATAIGCILHPSLADGAHLCCHCLLKRTREQRVRGLVRRRRVLCCSSPLGSGLRRRSAPVESLACLGRAPLPHLGLVWPVLVIIHKRVLDVQGKSRADGAPLQGTATSRLSPEVRGRVGAARTAV